MDGVSFKWIFLKLLENTGWNPNFFSLTKYCSIFWSCRLETIFKTHFLNLCSWHYSLKSLVWSLWAIDNWLLKKLFTNYWISNDSRDGWDDAQYEIIIEGEDESFGSTVKVKLTINKTLALDQIKLFMLKCTFRP